MTKPSSILQQTQYTLRVEGSLVTITFGNVPITMDYQTCIEVSKRMRIMGRQAKRNAGDFSRDINALGHLTDANEDEKRWQSLRDATAKFK